MIRRIQGGDKEGVGALYDRYGGIAYGLARRITNDGTLAEDVVQEAFVSVWRQAPRFDPARGQVRAWLLAIVHHKAIDAVRRRTVRSERSLPDGVDELHSSRSQPEELAEWSMDAQAVRDAVAQVPPEQRTVIELAYFAGLTHVEIARRSGIPVGTVKSRLRLGLEKMREYLRPRVIG